ncbi:hypothetical protein AB1Y20_014207 [Prymnesium parvum]|uniref:Enhancer of polycomb-like protein n=1 Tax=Prymnesium parvum TaxID=97485 RepID=A0AB34IF31_PRYPA
MSTTLSWSSTALNNERRSNCKKILRQHHAHARFLAPPAPPLPLLRSVRCSGLQTCTSKYAEYLGATMTSAASAERVALAKVKRREMANVFATTQREMSEVVDELAVMRRSAIPYQSNQVVYGARNPIPTDAHLIPSKELMKAPTLPSFKRDNNKSLLHASGKPWASYERPTPDIYRHTTACLPSEAGANVEVGLPILDEEMWRAQYIEWTLQKNAYNPDIAAQLRTNVRKQAALSMVDPSLTKDPARTSENVKAALSSAEIMGPVPKASKQKLTLQKVFPR